MNHKEMIFVVFCLGGYNHRVHRRKISESAKVYLLSDNNLCALCENLRVLCG